MSQSSQASQPFTRQYFYILSTSGQLITTENNNKRHDALTDVLASTQLIHTVSRVYFQSAAYQAGYISSNYTLCDGHASVSNMSVFTYVLKVLWTSNSTYVPRDSTDMIP